MGHSTKKSVTTQNYEESGILCTIKPCIKMQNKTKQSANSQH